MRHLALALLLLPASARAQTLRKDCFNEINLLCPRLAGRSLDACLKDNFDNATARCKARLKGQAQAERARAPAPRRRADAPQAPSAPSGARVSGFSSDVREDDKSYPVSGAAVSELIASMGGSGLYDSIDNGRGAATTSGRLGVDFGTEPGPSGCGLTGARVTIFVSETLPLWDAPQGASADARDWWAKASSAIKKHEDGHRDRWAAAGRDAATYLERLAPMKDCAEMKRAVESEMEAAGVDAMRRNVDWDEQTRHGQAQFDEAFGRR